MLRRCVFMAIPGLARRWTIWAASLSILLTGVASGAECVDKLSISLTGTFPSSNLRNQSMEDAFSEIMASNIFQNRFSRFANQKLDPQGSESDQDDKDAVYHLTKHVLKNNLNWDLIFRGDYQFSGSGAALSVESVGDEGQGFFASNSWKHTYAGGEEQGIRISSAYAMLRSTVGLDLDAAIITDGDDPSANGREASTTCAACHYDSWFALDPISNLFPRVQRDENAEITGFDKSTVDGSQPVLGGLDVDSVEDLINELTGSNDFDFQSCKIAFEYIYGRLPFSEEDQLLQSCMRSFSKDNKIQTAIKHFVQDEGFCS